jgi:hypothetical protein
MARLVIEDRGTDHLRQKMAEQLNCKLEDVPEAPEEWVRFEEQQIREAFGKAAKAKKAEWFKRVDLAEQLANVVLESWPEICDTPLGEGVNRLITWVHD